jgi:hypothetical protein
LAMQHPNLDLDHVEPAGVLGDIVELQPAQHAVRFASGERLIERTGRVCRQVVHYDPDPLRHGVVNVRELTHADGEVHCGVNIQG